MVSLVSGPDQPDPVGDAVIRVVQQIDTKERDDPGVPVGCRKVTLKPGTSGG
jgi:hypothetical protein